MSLIHRQHKMRAVPVVISLLVLLDGTLAQAESAAKAISSVFNGFLYFNLSFVNDTMKLVGENKTMQVQTDVCNQLTSLVPWYGAQKNSSTCTVKIDRQLTHVNYTILATDDFVQKYDPSCATYDILLATQVSRSPAFRGRYYLHFIRLETRNRTQPTGPSSTGLTAVRVDGPLYRSGGWLRWDEFKNFDDVTKEVQENVRKQFTEFLRLDPNNGSHINTERRKIYRETRFQRFTRMEAQITFNNSMLMANGINYTCPPFKQLVKASLDSGYFRSNTSFLGYPVNILEEKSDGRSVETTTASPTPEQTSTSSDSITTVRTTTRGDVSRITWRHFAGDAVSVAFHKVRGSCRLLSVSWIYDTDFHTPL
ncbi:hypothetical protein EG68_03889 [Paragonimus skrjabini miyazakii]|uniref:Uncharacterized protein n=1 Tax=Paragonimus skrjabini miyazakii TaxID=59628 RepID=A0A8S9YVD7_9TREM|nr:hypothetical protein EG68_03889 [Paragonimus skrjabini miyazakii]